jgi:D-3-phosphoglycerate dehydrogenase
MVYVHATFFLNILLCVFPYKILINDGLDACAIDILKKSGLIVNSQKYTHLQLLREISSYHAIVVRSATQVTADIIDAGHPNLKLIARAGVGLDNIDVNHAKQRNVVIVSFHL